MLLPALILCVLHNALIQKDMNHDGDSKDETTHGLTYSVARATEATAWQSVDAICYNLLPDSLFLSLDLHLIWLQRWGLQVAHVKKDGKSAFICLCHFI